MRPLTELNKVEEPFGTNEWLGCAVEEYVDGVRLRMECEERDLCIKGFFMVNIPFLRHEMQVCEITTDNIIMTYGKCLGKKKSSKIAIYICAQHGIVCGPTKGNYYLRCTRDEFEQAIHKFIRVMIAMDVLHEGLGLEEETR